MITMMHPLNVFHYCPRCGSSSFVVNDTRSKRCIDCDFIYYHNASSACVAVIFDAQGRLLCVRRRYAPAEGTLDLPGGFIDPGEKAETGVLREVYEETGCDAEVVRYLFSLPNTYIYSSFKVHTTDLFFLVRLKTGSVPIAHDDAASLNFISLDEIEVSDFGLSSIRRGVEKLLKEPLFCVEKNNRNVL